MGNDKLMNRVSVREIDLLGTRLCNCTLPEGVDFIDNAIVSSNKYKIMIRNAACINLSYENELYRKVVDDYHIRFVDGIGIYLAARILKGVRIPDLGGNPFGCAILQMCAERGHSVYLLGAKEDVIIKAAENFIERHKGLNIAGYHHGYFKTDGTEDVIRDINDCSPDLLIVCFGKPKEVFWIAENFGKLNVGVLIPLGGFLDFQSGHTKRAPKWILKLRFEWLFRLLLEPRRLWKRYILGNFSFMVKVLTWKALGK